MSHGTKTGTKWYCIQIQSGSQLEATRAPSPAIASWTKQYQKTMAAAAKMRSQDKKNQTLVQLTTLQSMKISKSKKSKIQLEKTNKKTKNSRLYIRKLNSIKR